MTQMRQLAGIRGLMQTATGHTLELPVKSNFREGLNILEYFMAARSARKALSDTALRTADSGYLTRRLVDVSQEVIIREENCGTRSGIKVRDIVDGQEVIEKLIDRIVGRYVIGDVVDPRDGSVIVADDTMISLEQAEAIIAAGITEVNVRTILQCKCKFGVCSHCYGSDLATGNKVNVGEAVGIIAAQSIGEPGTQLTMRNFHTGGVAGASDITQGLPRVEELFEARRPKKTATIADLSGLVSISENKRARVVTITNAATEETVAYQIPFGTHVTVNEGDYVAKGDAITEGYFAPGDITRVMGLDAVYDYIIREVQRVYRLQSVEINDKHIEVIARQMTRKVRIEDSGDSSFLVGTMVDVIDFETANEEIQARIDAGERTLRLATCTPVLLGITKASLQTESFLSAASFQETTKVLTEAAINGKVDHLVGLKENVLIGKLIPAGTGMERYRDVVVSKANMMQGDVVEVSETTEEVVESDSAE